MHDRQDELRIKAFGKKLRKLRREKGLSYNAFAHACDLSHQHIQKIEKGITNPSLTTILRLAAGLGVDPGELMK